MFYLAVQLKFSGIQLLWIYI